MSEDLDSESLETYKDLYHDSLREIRTTLEGRIALPEKTTGINSILNSFRDKLENNENLDSKIKMQYGLLTHEIFNSTNTLSYFQNLDEDLIDFYRPNFTIAKNQGKSVASLANLLEKFTDESVEEISLHEIVTSLSHYYKEGDEGNNRKINFSFDPNIKINIEYSLIVRTLLDNAANAGATEININFMDGRFSISDNASAVTENTSEKIRAVINSVFEYRNMSLIEIQKELEDRVHEGLKMSLMLLIYFYKINSAQQPVELVTLNDLEDGTKTLSFKMI